MPMLTPIEIAALVALLLIGFAFGHFGNTFDSRWRRRFYDEKRFYAEYRDKTDALNLEKTQRIAALERELDALKQSNLVGEQSVATHDMMDQATPEASAAPVEKASPTELAWAADPLPEPAHDAAPEAIAHDDPIDESAGLAAANDPEPAPMLAAIAPVIAGGSLPIVASEMAQGAVDMPIEMPHVETSDAPAPAIAAIQEAAHEPMASSPAAPVAADALSRIRGIDDDLARKLSGCGINSVQDIEKLSAEDEMALEIQLDLPPAYIAREQWRLQAALLGSGDEGAYQARFGDAEPAHA